MNTMPKHLLSLALGLTLAAGASSALYSDTALAARDRGANQAGTLGNRGGAPGAGAVDPGLNQSGTTGNLGGTKARDPGANQTGAAGNQRTRPARDPNLNQPAAVGNNQRGRRR
jgi:hypothetical protein